MEKIRTERLYSEHPPAGTVAGASLFVFSIDPTWGNIYFWLGKERKNVRWPQGSETWSDFGGRAQNEQEDPPHIAAREFWEETGAMLRYFEHDEIPRQGMEDIADSLRRGEYLFCITMWTETPQGEKRLFVTYVKQIPWSPEAFHAFQEAQQYIHKLRGQLVCSPHRQPHNIQEVLSVFPHPAIVQSPSGSIHIAKDFLEKKSIRMWSIPQLRAAIELQLLREERERQRKRMPPLLSPPVPYPSPLPVAVEESEVMTMSLAMQRDRFRSCFISMATTILRELPLYEPFIHEKSRV